MMPGSTLYTPKPAPEMKKIYAVYTFFGSDDSDDMTLADCHAYVRKDIPGPHWLYSHHIHNTEEYVFDAIVADDQVPSHPNIVLVEES